MALNCGAHRMRDNGEYYFKATCPDCLALNGNVEYSRAYQTVVYVDKAWLTNDFEESEESGWEELEKQIRSSLPALRDVRLEYEGWVEEPVVEDGRGTL